MTLIVSNFYRPKLRSCEPHIPPGVVGGEGGGTQIRLAQAHCAGFRVRKNGSKPHLCAHLRDCEIRQVGETASQRVSQPAGQQASKAAGRQGGGSAIQRIGPAVRFASQFLPTSIVDFSAN